MRASASREPNRRAASIELVLGRIQPAERRGDLEPTRTGRSAARSVTMMKTPWHSWFAYLLDTGREAHRVEADARHGAGVQRVRELHAVDPRRADVLERRVGSAAHRQVRALDRADAGVERGLVHVAHVGRRIDPGQRRVVEPVVAPPVLHRHDRQVRADLVLGVEELRQLAERHPVPDRHRREISGEPDRLLVERGSFNLPAVHRVRPVQHEDRQLQLRRLLHHDTPSSSYRCRSARRCPAGR